MKRFRLSDLTPVADCGKLRKFEIYNGYEPKWLPVPQSCMLESPPLTYTTRQNGALPEIAESRRYYVGVIPVCYATGYIDGKWELSIMSQDAAVWFDNDLEMTNFIVKELTTDANKRE